MRRDRHLEWEGCWNVRDLGGLRTASGGTTRWGAVVRSESLDRMTARGWAALENYRIRTVVDLRNSDQRVAEPQHPPQCVTTIHVPLEEDLDADAEFAGWSATRWLGTPLYYGRFLTRWPDRLAAACTAIARADSAGGVVVHCGKGCDRTGLVVMVLLALVGVEPAEIVADYELTGERVRSPVARKLGRSDDSELIDEVLRRERTTSAAVIADTLTRFDIPSHLRDAGLDDHDLATLRTRLLRR